MGRALITDLYELNMAASYLCRGMRQQATFSLFVRELPDDRGFYVAAGIDDCLDYLESFAFDDDDVAWMRAHGFPADMVDLLAPVRFTGDVHAVAEGNVVTANEPIMEVTAPLAEAQLVETYLLNRVTFQSVLTTKAARCRVAAGPIQMVDFALRRTHGIDAAMAFARASAIAGFVATSNVEAARLLDLRPAGTMAHSYVEAFGSEADAFRAFVRDLPGPYTFLVDTYDTLEGVRAAAGVITELGLEGTLAIRLDSGDLAELAKQSRKILDAAGLPHVRIFVSGALDEYALDALRRSGAPVDAAGVGTRVGVSADAPYVDSVYKLVALDDEPVAKLSPGKETLPGAKQLWRRLPDPDILTLRDEQGPEGFRPMLRPVMRGGRRLSHRASIADARARLEADLAALPEAVLRIRGPVPHTVTVSQRLQALADDLRASLQPGAHAPRPSPAAHARAAAQGEASDSAR